MNLSFKIPTWFLIAIVLLVIFVLYKICSTEGFINYNALLVLIPPINYQILMLVVTYCMITITFILNPERLFVYGDK